MTLPPNAPDRPLLITMGDACGIGPEIVVRAFASGAAGGCVVVGDPAVLQRAAAVVGGGPPIALLDHPADLAEPGLCPPGCLPVCAPADLPGGLAGLPWGEVHADAGRAAARCIEQAVRWVREGHAAGIVTAPIHKEALAAAGVPYPGHTEMLQALSVPEGAEPPAVRMMLANPELRVVLVTIHLSLRRAIEAVTQRAALAWGLPHAPRIAVAGLNPHAGEGGLFGDEELRIIAPAIGAARGEGIDALGPFPPDTVFMQARTGRFDVVVAMTHDHGLIPVKYLGVADGVNVTLGLPFVRTSPDHGTAFDIAGRGMADPASLVLALRMARRLVATA
jgi:4-hydroxythreonine-4-phosphate dehydrogenase